MTESKKMPIVQQVYKGLKAFGYYEASYHLLLSFVFLLMITILIVGFFGMNEYIAFAAKIVSVNKEYPNASHVTIEITSPDNKVSQVNTTISRTNVKAGDVVRLYIDPSDYSMVSEHKPQKFNIIGNTTIIICVILSLLMLIRFVLIVSFPGLAAATPILQAIRRR